MHAISSGHLRLSVCSVLLRLEDQVHIWTDRKGFHLLEGAAYTQLQLRTQASRKYAGKCISTVDLSSRLPVPAARSWYCLNAVDHLPGGQHFMFYAESNMERANADCEIYYSVIIFCVGGGGGCGLSFSGAGVCLICSLDTMVQCDAAFSV